MNGSLKPNKVDVAVLLIFFCRPEPFAQTFAAVKKARPSKLFLYQDGPREGEKHDGDVAGIAACRQIAEDIDWKCEVHTFYQEKNVGCDPSEYIAQKWAFEHVEKCIILEDDDVAAQSFFPYCKELLDRYERDDRIAMICGMNHLGEYHANGCSYFFTDTGPIWGWATWRRVVDSWEEHYDALGIPYVVDLMKRNYRAIGLDEHVNAMFRHKADGRAFYETILGLSRFAQNRLCIVPAVNLIHNLGNMQEATHPTNNPDSWIYRIAVSEVAFPLSHPRYVVNDVHYSREVNFRMNGSPSVLRRVLRWCKRKLVRR